MNEKFFSLPAEKQQAIINAGYRVFSQNSYKKSPMNDIAEAAGISKALLFHYFHNKKELYLFLWEQCARLTHTYMERFHCYEQADVFDMTFRGLQAKAHMMRRYPDLGKFSLKAFYEKDPAVCREIQESVAKLASYGTTAPKLKPDPERFLPGLDLELMYQDMYWASEGYMWEKMQQGTVDVDEMERDFQKLIAFWKTVYLRKEENV